MSYEDFKKDKKELDKISTNFERLINSKQLNDPCITHNKIRHWAKLFMKNYEKAFSHEIEEGREDLEYTNFIGIYQKARDKNLIPRLEILFTIYKILRNKIWFRLLHPRDL